MPAVPGVGLVEEVEGCCTKDRGLDIAILGGLVLVAPGFAPISNIPLLLPLLPLLLAASSVSKSDRS